ncbi:MAG: ATP-dependent helicase C-terminal domain-containing protein, partial [Polyangia bacterium]|nr:ATP-dependent helicase C-terminal domain-containing protein [Polyangia bacterium]
ATQRAGRAGRTAPGRAYRLWTESEQEALLEREVPEILRVDLSGAVLLLRSFGCPDPMTFRWFEAPPGAAILRAEALLELLGALDGRGLTPLGRRLAALPLHPRLGRMLLEAHDTGCLREGAELAALLDGREVLSGEQDGGMTAKEDGAHGHGSDLLYRRELVFGPTGRTDPDDDLDPGAARAGAASSIRDQAEHLLGQARSVLGPEPAGAPASDEALLGIMLAGFADRVAAQRAGKQDEYKLVGGRGAKLHPGSGAMGARLILVHRLDDDPSRPLAFIRQASALPESLLDERGGIFAEEHLEWDDAEGRVVAEQTRRWGDLVLSKRAAPVRDRAEAGELLARMAAKDPRRALAPPPGVERLLARITLLAKALPEEGLPESAEELLADAAAKLCPGLLSFGELRRMDLAQAILGKLGPRGRRLIAEEAPETIGVPSGRKLPIRYVQGEAPVLPVKLQELFGLAEGPRIARGRVGLALHLLSPAGRPVQITEDLASFWKVGYQAVRRELRGRYPKHPWPEDPCSALATARVTPRRR